MIRQIGGAARRPISILADMQGPKLRVGQFAEGGAEMKPGARFTFDADLEPGSADRVHLPHPEILSALQPGHVVHGLRERADWATSDVLAEALDLIEVAHRYGPVVRAAALDEADCVEAGIAHARRLGAGPVAGFATVLTADSPIRFDDAQARPW